MNDLTRLIEIANADQLIMSSETHFLVTLHETFTAFFNNAEISRSYDRSFTLDRMYYFVGRNAETQPKGLSFVADAMSFSFDGKIDRAIIIEIILIVVSKNVSLIKDQLNEVHTLIQSVTEITYLKHPRTLPYQLSPSQKIMNVKFVFDLSSFFKEKYKKRAICAAVMYQALGGCNEMRLIEFARNQGVTMDHVYNIMNRLNYIQKKVV